MYTILKKEGKRCCWCLKNH